MVYELGHTGKVLCCLTLHTSFRQLLWHQLEHNPKSVPSASICSLPSFCFTGLARETDVSALHNAISFYKSLIDVTDLF